jgi:hypothetical protein
MGRTDVPFHTSSAVGRRWVRVGSGVVLAMVLALVAHTPSANASATIYFRSVSSANPSSSTTSLSLPAPANITVGDLLFLDIDSSAGVPSQSATFTQSYDSFDSYLGWTVVTAGNIASSYTISLSSGGAANVRLIDYVGTKTSSPVTPSGTVSPTLGFGSTSLSYSSITPAAAGSMIMVGTDAEATGDTITPPSGFTSRIHQSASGSSSDNSDWLDPSSSATGTKTGSLSSGANWGTAVFAFAPAASGTLQFSTSPNTPTLPGVTLNGLPQTVSAQMSNFGVDDTTGSGSGWNVTVNGNTGGGLSPVFAQYCPNATCGSDTGPAYVASGQTLPASSLTLSTTGASWSTTGGSGSAPTFTCSAGCAMDSGSAVKVASAAVSAGEGPWSTSGLGASSVSLSTPTTLRTLSNGEVYRVDLLWTLSSTP